MSSERVILVLSGVACAVLVLYPLAWIVLRSFSSSGFGSPLTLKWYAAAFTEPGVRAAIMNTTVLVLGSMAVAVVFGVLTAFLTARTDIPLAPALRLIALLPFLIPPFVLAVGWVMLASPTIGFLNLMLRTILRLTTGSGPLDVYTMKGMIVVSGLYVTPYVYLLAFAGFRSMDPALEEAARMSGAGWPAVLRNITLPVLAPALLAGCLLAVVIAAGQFVIPITLGTPAKVQVLGTLIWTEVATWAPRAEMAAVEGFILVVFGLVCLTLQRRILSRRRFATITGRGFRPRRIALGRWRYPALFVCGFYVLLAGLLPLGAVLLTSFLRFWTTSLSSDLFTLRQYALVITYPKVWLAAWNSLFLAVVGSTVAMAFAVVLSWMVLRARARGGHFVAYVSTIPLGLPGVALAVGILNAYINPPWELYGTIWLLLVAYITGYLPFGVQSASAALHQVSEELEDASRVSGASWVRTLVLVTGPLIRPGLISGWIFLSVIFLREMSLSILLYTPKTVVLSVGLFDIWTEGDYPQLAAFSVLILVLSVGLVLIAEHFGEARYEQTGVSQ